HIDLARRVGLMERGYLTGQALPLGERMGQIGLIGQSASATMRPLHRNHAERQLLLFHDSAESISGSEVAARPVHGEYYCLSGRDAGRGPDFVPNGHTA